MSDDLDDLRARVAAARDRLAHDVDFAQKVELRLNDLARIVEGSLARQNTELEGAKARIGTLETDLERALARAEQAMGEATRADRLSKENGDLRSMVMTLLEVIEGRQKSSLTSVMQKLEENVSSLVATPAAAAVSSEPVAVVEPMSAAGPEVEPEPAPEQHDLGPEPAIDVELETEPQIHTEDDSIDAALDEAARAGTPPLEDLSEIALYDAADEVVDPGRS